MSNDLIPSVSIENLLNQRQAMIDRFVQMQTLAEELKSLQAVLGDSYPPRIEFESRGHKETLIDYWGHHKNAEHLATYVKEIDALAWKMLMEKSGNLTFMDSTAREEWSKSISDGKFPELTMENIAATFKDLHASRADMFHRSIIKLFQKLSWDYKTNLPFRFGKRIIVSYMNGYHNTGKDKLDDLTRAFCVLDSKPEPDYQRGFNRLIQYGQTTGTVETEYLKLVWYKNGNGHVTFKRMDLVEKMNKILHLYYPNAIASDVREAA